MGLGIRAILASLAALTVTTSASAQASTSDALKLINLDTAHVLAPGDFSVRGDYRGFGGDEGISYGSVDINLGIDQGLGLLLRSTFSRTTTFFGDGFDIRHGGVDGEALIKYACPHFENLAFLGGVALTNTPSHKDAFGVAEAVYDYPVKGADLYGNAKIAFASDTTILALGVGGSVDLTQGFQLIGDFAAPLTGKNTYSTSSGNTQRDVLYGVAIRYTPSGMVRGSLSFDAGLTNGLGGSTGFSLTPSLNSTVGFYFAATYRY